MISKGQVIEVVDTYDVAFHSQRIGCQPEQLLYPVASPARALLIREKKEIEKTRSPPPPLPPARCSFGENRQKITPRIYMPRRYAGLGSSRVCTRIPSTRRLGQLVSIRKILRFRVR